MGLNRSLVALMLALALAGCVSLPTPNVVAGPPEPPPPADLDGLAYGRPGSMPPPVVPVAAAPVLPPMPAAVMPGPAPGDEVPYTLDSGDRLRVVVFGQDGLSNSYIVDVGGR